LSGSTVYHWWCVASNNNPNAERAKYTSIETGRITTKQIMTFDAYNSGMEIAANGNLLYLNLLILIISMLIAEMYQ